MKLKWRDYGAGVWQADGLCYVLWAIPSEGGVVAQAGFGGEKNATRGFATADEAKREAEQMLARMVAAMEERIKQIKEQLS